MILDHGSVCHYHDLDPVLLGPWWPGVPPVLSRLPLVLHIKDVVAVVVDRIASNVVVVVVVVVAVAAPHLELDVTLGKGGGSRILVIEMLQPLKVRAGRPAGPLNTEIILKGCKVTGKIKRCQIFFLIKGGLTIKEGPGFVLVDFVPLFPVFEIFCGNEI